MILICPFNETVLTAQCCLRHVVQQLMSPFPSQASLSITPSHQAVHLLIPVLIMTAHRSSPSPPLKPCLLAALYHGVSRGCTLQPHRGPASALRLVQQSTRWPTPCSRRSQSTHTATSLCHQQHHSQQQPQQQQQPGAGAGGLGAACAAGWQLVAVCTLCWAGRGWSGAVVTLSSCESRRV